MNLTRKQILLIGVAITGVLAVFMVTMVVAVAATVYFMKRGQPAPQPQPTPVVVTSEITNMLKGNPEDAAKVRDLFGALAVVVEKDSTLIKSTTDIQQANSLAGRLAFNGELKGKYPNLGSTVDAVIMEALGDQRRALDGDLRSRAVRALKNVSGAAGDAVGG